MNKLRLIVMIVLVIVSKNSFGQQEYYFTTGLAANGVHRYGREALYSDKLAYQLYTNTLKKPVDGGSLGITNNRGEEIKWQSVKADSANRFRSRGFVFGGGGGYTYFTYNADKEKIALLNITGNSALYFNGELHAGDPYGSGWLYIPVKLKKGLNELYTRS